MKYLKLYEYYNVNHSDRKLVSINHAIGDMINQAFAPKLSKLPNPYHYELNYYMNWDTKLDYILLIYKNYKLFISEYEDEWFAVQMVKIEWREGPGIHAFHRDLDKTRETHWCDQSYGLMEFLKSKLIDSVKESKTYYITSDPEGPNEINISKMDIPFTEDDPIIKDIKILLDDMGISIGKYSLYLSNKKIILLIWIDGWQKQFNQEEKVMAVNIQISRYEDEWFYVRVNLKEYYWCDQESGLFDFLKDKLSHVKNNLSESKSYYTKDEVDINKKFIYFSEEDTIIKDIEKLLRDIRISYGYYNLYISHDKTLRLVTWVDRNQVNVYISKYEDEWFRVLVGVNSQPWEYYWCDQESGLLDCLKDKLRIVNSWKRVPMLSQNQINLSESKSYYNTDEMGINKEFIPFGEEDTVIKDIKLLFNAYDYTIYISYDKSIRLNVWVTTRSIKFFKINIYKYQDEWFRLNIGTNYYWCDQASGLLDCLKDKLGIKTP